MNAGCIGATSPAILCRLRIHRRRKLASLSRSSPFKACALSSTLHISSSVLRRPRGRRPSPDQRLRQKPVDQDRNVEFSVDLDDICAGTLARIKRLFRSSEAKIDRFFASGAEACSDLKTSFRIDRGSRIVFSCRRSSLQFFGNLFLWSFIAILASSFLSWLWSFRHRWFFVGWAITRRDRSLGGREVVVGRRDRMRGPERTGFKGLVNPLSTVGGKEVKGKATLMNKQKNRQEKLPKWWPDSIPSPIVLFAKDEGQRDADKLVKAIMDNRMSGKDYKDDDIIQLREICRSSGAKVSFETTNARDSFFRAAISFVLNVCSRVRQPGSPVQIGGEEVKQFICGIAENIGLDSLRAARLVCAAVAARSRSCFLQSWPELEMVASGLTNSLKIDQREHLLTLFSGICSSDGLRIATEALGLGSNASV
ncbi:hypothetical protein KFK09_008472 [Dendrobium nobile]|uniref:Uncharacterized protein n=1 Tax=Dendrobium nobile TaxID=94219 RepID=A0A8T3BK71_DENNO|nr:hypothetical protein KFK09_008472 [Dendrobium nobile]